MMLTRVNAVCKKTHNLKPLLQLVTETCNSHNHFAKARLGSSHHAHYGKGAVGTVGATVPAIFSQGPRPVYFAPQIIRDKTTLSYLEADLCPSLRSINTFPFIPRRPLENKLRLSYQFTLILLPLQFHVMPHENAICWHRN